MVVFADPKLPHQIVLRLVGYDIAVGCNCMSGFFEMRCRWDDPGEPMRIWRAHMAEVG